MSDKYNILLVENIHPCAAEELQKHGMKVTTLGYAPGEQELVTLLKDFDVIGIRSKTNLTREVVQANPHLITVGAFCIGTNQIDLKACSQFGVPVFNAPHSNTRSVAELVIANMINLARQVCDRSMHAHNGGWDKSASGSFEVRGKTVGIIGYGHIGSQVSILAESLGMKVIFYDTVKKLPLGNAKGIATLDELLAEADFVTLHVPELPSTKDLITARELKKMKQGSFLINYSRGTVVDIDALAQALKDKHIAGAAVDVFPHEPASNKEKFESPLQNLTNVILTPHIGGSTEEAQRAIGLEVAESLLRFLLIGATGGAVNFPNVDLPMRANSSRLLNVHKNEPGVLGEINSIVSKRGVNIDAQYLATNEDIGYLVMDVHVDHASMLEKEVKALSRSIKTRLTR